MTITEAIQASSMNAATDSVRHGSLYETPTNPPEARWHYGWMENGTSRFVEAATLDALLAKMAKRPDDCWEPMERPL